MSKIKIQGSASGTGVLTIAAPNTNTDRTITIPDVTGTLLDSGSDLPAANLTGTIADARLSSGITSAKLPLAGGTMTGNIAHAGAFTLDVGSEINLDSDSGYVYLQDAGTSIGLFKLTSSDFYIKSVVSDKDIIFQGNDGGSGFTALTLDMSDAGAATFNNHITATGNIYTAGNINLTVDNKKIRLGAGEDLQIYHDGTHSYIKDTGTGNLRIAGDEVGFTNTAATDWMVQGIQAGAVNLYHNGSAKLATSSEGIDVTGEIKTSAGSGASPSHTFTSDTDSGMFSGGANVLSFATGSLERWRMENDGDFHADGDVIAYSTTISDERLKENIQPIEDALSKVNQLKGCTFTYTPDGKQSAGLIAQDVEKVLPSAVSEKELPLKQDDGKEYKVLQYDQTIGLLVEAIKELTDKVEKLEAR
jgi:hypothetical protein